MALLSSLRGNHLQMNTTDTTPAIRELYEEFPIGAQTVSMISDPENPNAWIQSNKTRPIEQ